MFTGPLVVFVDRIEVREVCGMGHNTHSLISVSVLLYDAELYIESEWTAIYSMYSLKLSKIL